MVPTLGLLLLLAGQPTSSEVAPEDVIWMSVDRANPYFLPATLLEGPTPARLRAAGVTQQSADAVRDSASAARKAPTPEQGCALPTYGSIEGPPPGSPASRQTLIERALSVKDVAFLGEVVELVPGWIVPSGYAGTLVRVRVQEVFSDPQQTLQVGQATAYVQSAGSMRIGDHVTCTKDSRFVSAVVGDRLLVTGSYSPGNDQYLDSNGQIAFHVRDGLVLHPPTEPMGSGDGIALSEVRAIRARERRKS
jgi:hypothetical protein